MLVRDGHVEVFIASRAGDVGSDCSVGFLFIGVTLNMSNGYSYKVAVFTQSRCHV